MSRLLFNGLIVFTVVLTGCQKTNLSSQPKTQASFVAPVPGQPLPPQRPPMPPPPPYTGGIPVGGLQPPPMPPPPPPLPPGQPQFPQGPPPPQTINNPPPQTPVQPPPVRPSGPSNPGYPMPPDSPSQPTQTVTTVDDYPRTIDVGGNDTSPPPASPPHPTQTGVPPNLQQPPLTEWNDIPNPIPQQPVAPTEGGPTQTVAALPPPPQDNCLIMKCAEPTPLPANVPLPPPRPVSLQAATAAPAPVAANPFANAPLPPRRPVEKATTNFNFPGGVAPLPPSRPTNLGAAEPAAPVVQNKVCPPQAIDAKLDTTKLDVLFVVDSSASLRGGVTKGTGGELGQLARDMELYAQRLDKAIDYHIGMIVAHGPASPIHGRLFKADAHDPAVIKLSDMKVGCKGNEDAIRQCAEKKIGKLLENKMIKMPNESHGAQGEALLLSLYDSIMKPGLLADIRKEDFYRKDAKLEVIMISDEQDVCFDYSTTTDKPVQVAIKDSKGRITGYAQDPVEIAFYNDKRPGKGCIVAKGARLTPDHVWDALLSLKGKDENKLIVTGVVYQSNEGLTTPQGRALHPQDENEKGHGMLELIQRGGKPSMDLAKAIDDKGRVSFAKQLDALGKMTDDNMRYMGRFTCHIDGLNPNTANVSTMLVEVKDNRNNSLATFSGSCTTSPCRDENFSGPVTTRVTYDKSGNPTNLVVDIRDFNETLKAKNFQEGNVYISFDTRSDMNPDGSLVGGSSARKKNARK